MHESTSPQSKPTFGEYLQALVDARPQWTTPKLAAALGVDASLVRRWLRNDRVPPFSSNYLERIAELLRLSPTERQQLEASQVTSQQARAHGTLAQRRSAESQGVAALLKEAATAPSKQKDIGSLPQNRFVLPTDGEPIRGVTTVCEAALELLRQASEQDITANTAPTIYLTYQGARSITEVADLDEQWEAAMRSVRMKGWNIRHLLRLDSNALRSVHFVKDMLGYLGAPGMYEPSYFEPHGILVAPYDLIIVPNLGCLLLISTQQSDVVDAATYSTDREVMRLLHDHFVLLQRSTKPLFKLYPDDTSEGLDKMLEMELDRSDRFLMKGGLSSLWRPLSVYSDRSHYQEQLQARNEPPAATILRATRRRANFEDQASSGQFILRDVCPKVAIERLVYDSLQFERGTSSYEHEQFPPEICVALLQNAIDGLRTYTSYEIGLLDEELDTLHSSWEVKRGHSVYLDIWRLDEENRQIEYDLYITEPTIVRAFWDYSEELWNRISPKNRAKDYVIWWLEQQLEKLKKQMAERAGE